MYDLVCVCVRVCVCVCACVNHLFAKVFSSSVCRGAEEAHRALSNEALYGVLRTLGLINPAYLHKVGRFSFFPNKIFRQ